MRVKFVEISNFRRLKSTHLDLDEKTTIFVGANNSGKTSAMVALRYFLLAPKRLTLKDVTITNWTEIDAVGGAWEAGEKTDINLETLLPVLDVWLDVPLTEIQHVVHILPTLNWNGGLLGVRLKYQLEDINALKSDYLTQRSAALKTVAKNNGDKVVQIWPRSLTDFLERRLQKHVKMSSFVLDPNAVVAPKNGYATLQVLPETALSLEKDPFKNLIKIDDIAAQRDFSDANERTSNNDDQREGSPRRFKRRLSEQLRTYFDRHLDPRKTPTEDDYDALHAIQTAERNFDQRLEKGFEAAFKELEELGYPGISNPKLKITTQLHATDGLDHSSAVQYQIADPSGDGSKALRLPEDYSGLGYQNLIAMVFMLMGYRDDWMRVGKASTAVEHAERMQIPLLHIVLVEEPEAHLHAQVQQVFIKKAYELLRKHSSLGDNPTYRTQLIVSTHSSHVAHEADFANLRYFRRRTAKGIDEIPTTTVTNLSYVFGDGDETKRFVKRYLKATHCDLFFADGVIFVEGQAERILVPHFIRYHFPSLSRRYVTLLDLGGSHAHRFKDLVDELGLTTLIIADLDATKLDTSSNRWKSIKPQRKDSQKTANSVLKSWYPGKESIDDLLSLKPAEHQTTGPDGYKLYVAFQKPLPEPSSKNGELIPRTFEDAFIFENRDALGTLTGSSTAVKVQQIVNKNLSGELLADELFELLKSAEKAAFALDCLMMDDAAAIKPPTYIKDGLSWFEKVVSETVESDSEGIDK